MMTLVKLQNNHYCYCQQPLSIIGPSSFISTIISSNKISEDIATLSIYYHTLHSGHA